MAKKYRMKKSCQTAGLQTLLVTKTKNFYKNLTTIDTTTCKSHVPGFFQIQKILPGE